MKKDTAFAELAFETLDLDSSTRYILSSKLKKNCFTKRKT